jgi:hypothetical protein
MSEHDARKGKRYDAGKEKHPNKNKTTRKGTRRA